MRSVALLLSPMRTPYIWKLPRKSFELGQQTLIMGILNVTPDSFSDGGLYTTPERALERAIKIESDGADILDIGGESTRPDSLPITVDEEIRRVVPTIEQLVRVLQIPISVDTYRAEVAKRAIEAGAPVVNDISGLRLDPEMGQVVAQTGVGVVVMQSEGNRTELHLRKTAHTPESVSYQLGQTIEKVIQQGVAQNAILADPGLGFSKSSMTSLKILENLGIFSKIGYPLLVGVSRKSFIKINMSDMDAALWTTAASVAIAITNGAHAIRVHDVGQMKAVAAMAEAIG